MPQNSSRAGGLAAGLAGALGVAAIVELAIRPAAEFATLLADPIFWGFGVPRGDGHPVLLIPGLLANDDYLQALSGWIRRAGYRPLWSGLPLNRGWSREAVEAIGERVESEYRQSGARVTIIGHSMGGALARSVALRRPLAVRQVIALAAPLGYEAAERLSLSVAITALYSRGDPIVRYPHAVARESHAHNFEVRGSHSGLAFNPEVYRHLSRLLAARA